MEDSSSPMLRVRKHDSKLFTTKYTQDELAQMDSQFHSYKVQDKLPELLTIANEEKCIKFLGSENKIMLTSAQQIVN